jgi:hypothetical protein
MAQSKTAQSTAASLTPPEAAPAVVIGLHAAIIAVFEEAPHVLVVRHEAETGSMHGTTDAPLADLAREGLPFGPFEPLAHRTMEIGLRAWVAEQTQLSLGHVEQLYTFGDRGRHATAEGKEPHVVSVGYLALTRHTPLPPRAGALWRNWYRYFPWEDWRTERPKGIGLVIEPLLKEWIKAGDSAEQCAQRRDRANLCFGLAGLPWNEELVLERYELLYTAGLVYEARRDRPQLHLGLERRLSEREAGNSVLGEPMIFDHRRILATAIGRLRGKLKYRPLVFELMPPAFTLLELQRTVEAISGVRLHKQNFRRLLARTGLVEPTGQVTTKTGGRPAEQFRFRREVLRERPAPGMRLPQSRAARS